MYKRIPKAQKGMAKIAKSMKTAKKISNVAKKGAPAIVRKAKGVKSAQKTLSQSGLSGVTPSQLRSQFNELLKQASALSKKKASTKKLALKQKGGSIKAKSISGKPPVPKEATSKRARRKTGKMLDAVTGTKSPRSKKQLARRIKKGKVGTGLILPKKQKGGTTKGMRPPKRLKGKGGQDFRIGTLTPSQKRYLRKLKNTNPLTPPGTAKSKKALKKASRKRG